MVLIFRKDVRLPIQLQRAMAAEAEAARESRAKVMIRMSIMIMTVMPLNDVSSDLVPEYLIPQTQIPGTDTIINFQMIQHPNLCCDKTL